MFLVRRLVPFLFLILVIVIVLFRKTRRKIIMKQESASAKKKRMLLQELFFVNLLLLFVVNLFLRVKLLLQLVTGASHGHGIRSTPMIQESASAKTKKMRNMKNEKNTKAKSKNRHIRHIRHIRHDLDSVPEQCLQSENEAQIATERKTKSNCKKTLPPPGVTCDYVRSDFD